MTPPHALEELWHERFGRRLRLPLWASLLVIGALELLLSVLAILPFVPSVFSYVEVVDALVLTSGYLVGVSFFLLYTSSYLRRQVENLQGLIRLAESDAESLSPNLDGLSSTKRIAVVYLAVNAFAVPLFTLFQPGSVVSNLVGEIPFFFANFMLATFFWVFGYSMYAIYKLGELPLKLKPYTQDRMLGLKPFATASLRFTLIYLGIVSVIAGLVIFAGPLPLYASLVFLAFIPIGLLFFLLPLRSIHRTLVTAKAAEFAWIERRATSLMQKLKTEQTERIDPDIANQLLAIDKIQRDISQIRTWPFDTGLFARLAAIVFSVVAIILARILQLVFQLV